MFTPYFRGGVDTNEHETKSIEAADFAESIREQASLVLIEIYPELERRLTYVGFARWHRQNGEIKDLAQEAANQFLSHCCRNLVIPDDSLAYAVQIAANLARDRHRRQKKLTLDYSDEDLSQQHFVDPRSDDEEETEYSAEQIEKVRQAIDALPAKQREAFDLVNENPGARTVDLAARVGTTPDAFRMNADRAFKAVLKSVNDVE